ncbi:protein of unknown function [Hyphomicrobium sp. 1Nfss2.1]
MSAELAFGVLDGGLRQPSPVVHHGFHCGNAGGMAPTDCHRAKPDRVPKYAKQKSQEVREEA